jgi:diguanylate cyclase (GGDEF)-like protein/excisionase family DNA binding protein
MKADSEGVQDRAELRRHVARVLDERADAIVGPAVAVVPFSGPQTLDTNDIVRLCEAALSLLLSAVRDGPQDARSAVVTDLRRLSQDRSFSPQRLFELMYLIERSALDELALDETLGAESDQWAALTQLVRRASFDALGAFADHLTKEPGTGGVTDPLTTLHARPVLEAALDKEIHRAERFGHPFALVAFDVDKLTEINAAHGFGFGDRVLERIGIVMRQYFREQDWVTRHSEDTFVVLLPETAPEHAELLAERVRLMVEERLALRDYRTEQRVAVTVSVAVVIAAAVGGGMNADRMLRSAVQAVQRAKHAGRNRVEKVDVSATTLSVLGAARYLRMSQDEVIELVHAGRIAAREQDRTLRLDRAAVEQYRNQQSQIKNQK